jgi:hypothetical protein
VILPPGHRCEQTGSRPPFVSRRSGGCWLPVPRDHLRPRSRSPRAGSTVCAVPLARTVLPCLP